MNEYHHLKTLFNNAEAGGLIFKMVELWTVISVLYNDVQMDQ